MNATNTLNITILRKELLDDGAKLMSVFIPDPKVGFSLIAKIIEAPTIEEANKLINKIELIYKKHNLRFSPIVRMCLLMLWQESNRQPIYNRLNITITN